MFEQVLLFLKFRNDSDKERTTWQDMVASAKSSQHIITSRQGQDVVEVRQILDKIVLELNGEASADKVADIKERAKLIGTKLQTLTKVYSIIV